MNKKDLDALLVLYENVYSNEYLTEAPAATNVPYRVLRGLGGALRDLPAATMSQLQGQGANKGNDAALRRQAERGGRLNTLLRTGQVNKPTAPKPVSPSVQRQIDKNTKDRQTMNPQDYFGTRVDKPTEKPAPPNVRPPAPKPAAAKPATPGSGAKVAPAAAKPAGQTGDKAKDEATWRAANPTLANKPKTPNPLMKNMPGQNKAELDQLRGNAAINSISQSPSAKNILSGTAKSSTANQIGKASLDRSAAATEAKPASNVFSRSKETVKKMTSTPNPANQNISSGYEWPSAKTIRDIAGAYASIYEAKKKDQDEDGDNDFADVRIARMIASGMSKAEAIAAVKNKEYNEEFVTEDPIQDFRDMRASQNRGGARGPELSHSGPSKGIPKPGSAIATKQPRSREFSREGSSSTSRNTTGPSSPGYDTRRLGGSDLRRLTNSFEFESWVDSLVEEGYDLSDYTWEEMFDIYLDEAEGSYGATPKAYSAASKTKMTAKRKPFLKKMLSRTNPANRTSPYSSPRKGMSDEDRERARAGSKHGVGTRQDHDYPSEGPGGVSKSAKKLRKQKAMGEFGEAYEIDEAAKRTPKKTRGAKDPVAYMKGRSDAGKRISGDEDTGPRYYTLGRARGAEADAPTQPGQKPARTPKLAGWEKDDIQYRKANLRAGKTHKVGGEKGLPEEYEIYEIVASYLLENNFAATVNDANVIIENMSEVWLDQILTEKSGEQPLPYGRMMKKSDELADSDDKKKRKRAASIYLAANAPKGPKIKVR